MALIIPTLPRCSPFVLATAVRAAIIRAPEYDDHELHGRLPSSRRLGQAANQSHPSPDRKGDALLEAVYLVASADGLKPSERQALASLIAHVADGAAADVTCAKLDAFAARIADEGAAARIAAIAGSFDSWIECEEAVSLAVLLALADHQLVAREQQMLLQLGEALDFTEIEVQTLIHETARQLEGAIARAEASLS